MTFSRKVLDLSDGDNLISVVMPVYNGELYLRTTIDSVLNQTYSNFEFICVDDGSTDNSLSMLKEFKNSDPRIKIYQKENGGTVARAINYILDYISGHFFFYLSQDDILSENVLEKTFYRFKETGADVVLPDLIFLNHNNSINNKSVIGFNGDRGKILSNKDAVIASLDWRISGFGLWNFKIIKMLRFEDFSLNSDEYSTRIFFFNCNKVAFSEGVFYYRQRPNSITKKLTSRIFDFVETNRRLFHFLEENDFQKGIIDKQLIINATQLITSTRKYLRNASNFTLTEKSKIKSMLINAYKDIERKELYQLTLNSKFSKLKFGYYIFRSFEYFILWSSVVNLVVSIVKKFRINARIS